AMLTLGACLFAAATDAATMLVTEVQGNVATEASARRLAPVVALETKMQLRLAADARAVIAYVEDAHEFELRGPGRYRLDAAAPQPLADALPMITRARPRADRDVPLQPSQGRLLGVGARGAA